MVGFTDKERKHGEAALSGVRAHPHAPLMHSPALLSATYLPKRAAASAQINSNIKNTVTGLKQIIGKKFHSEEIQSEIPKVAYKMVESVGKVTIPVTYASVGRVCTTVGTP